MHSCQSDVTRTAKQPGYRGELLAWQAERGPLPQRQTSSDCRHNQADNDSKMKPGHRQKMRKPRRGERLPISGGYGAGQPHEHRRGDCASCVRQHGVYPGGDDLSRGLDERRRRSALACDRDPPDGCVRRFTVHGVTAIANHMRRAALYGPTIRKPYGRRGVFLHRTKSSPTPRKAGEPDLPLLIADAWKR
ncbi:hypothetical protein AA23498_1516 [Acetobacter nitrogenifigens DSM 23921 = NBRC 105050]|nr:hypothetical protein AA23498_1516 [Acetobacter nitrogenifigens DSM 23921 = NBRC 105050]